MTATTLETWTADGVLLNTYAYNLSTHKGRSGLAKIRGENEPIPLRGGRRWVPKVWDQKDLLLEMWVLGNDVDGYVPTLHTERAEFNENLAALKRVFGKRESLIELIRIEQRPSGPLTLTGHLEGIGTMEPTTSNGGTLGVMTVEAVMPDPFWYGALETITLTSAGTTHTNPGDTTAEKMNIDLVGPLLNPMVHNSTMGVSLRYTGSIDTGVTVSIDTDLFTAIDSTTTNRIGKLSNIGSNWWMNLGRGLNTLTLTNWQGGALGAGQAIITYYPPYL